MKPMQTAESGNNAKRRAWHIAVALDVNKSGEVDVHIWYL